MYHVVLYYFFESICVSDYVGVGERKKRKKEGCVCVCLKKCASNASFYLQQSAVVEIAIVVAVDSNSLLLYCKINFFIEITTLFNCKKLDHLL